MRILFKTGYLRHNLIVTELNNYWKALSYPQCKTGSNRKEIFHCERYSILVDKYAITVSDHYGDLNEQEQKEIKEMLEIIFRDKVVGYVDKYNSSDSMDLIRVVQSVTNIKKMHNEIVCRYNKQQVAACRTLVDQIPVTSENLEAITTLNGILDDFYKNTWGKEVNV